jgi:16S rRNA (uracil1498-N3)-methyltransferase
VRRRFFVEQFDGQRALVEGAKAHHLGRVLRAQVGQMYELSDGARVVLGRIESVGRDRVEFALLEELPGNEPRLQVTLLLAVVKFDSFEWAIEKATELGVSAIVPLAAARSEKGLLAAAEKRSERWEKIILEAAQQSRRVRLPVLRTLTRPQAAFSESLQGSQGAVAAHGAAVAGSDGNKEPCLREPGDVALGIFLSERAEAPPLRVALADKKALAVSLAIGPEGGWTDEECDLAAEAGFVSASLGQLILRTETAVVAALASVGFALGE